MPAAPSAPPVAAPAAPSPNAAPPVAASPAPSPVQDSGMGDAFAELDKMTEPGEPATPTAPSKEGDEPAEPAPTRKPGDVPPKAPEQRPEKAATLRSSYDNLKSKYAELEKKHKELETKSSQPKDDPEKKTLSEKLAKYEKQLEERDSELKFAKYEYTQEYKDKYLTPFSDAYEAGRNKVMAMKIKEPDVKDENTGEIVKAGSSRQGTEDDWNSLMRISDDDAAADFAAERFGSGAKAALAMYHRERVQELNGSRIKAIEDYRKNGAERELKQSEMSKKQHDDFTSAWKKHNDAAVEKYPNLFKPEEGDEKGNGLLSSGFAFASLAFGALDPSDVSKLPQSIQSVMVDGKLPQSEQAKVYSAVFNKAAAYDREVYRGKKRAARITELEAKLKAFEESEPGSGEGGERHDGVQDDESMDSVVASMEKLLK